MTTEITVTPQMQEALTWPEKAKAIVISNQETYDEAVAMKKGLAKLRATIVEEFKPMKEAAHKAHKAITAKEGEYLVPITTAEDYLGGGIKRFEDEQDRIRRAEQARLQKIARQQYEADRQERLRQAEIARQQEQERILAEAVQAEAMGIPVAVMELPPAEAFLEPAPYVAPVVAAPTYEKAKGTGIVRTWSAEVYDLKALVKAIADGIVPITYIDANMVALNSRARSDKQLMQVPGVRSVQK